MGKGTKFVKKTAVFLSSLFLFYSPAAFAGESEKTEEFIQDSITIKGEYIEIDAINSTKNVKVLTKEQIQDKGYESLSEALDDLPAINVSKSGYGEIDIRGQGSRTASRNIQIMVDGAPIGVLTQHPYKTDYNIIPVDQIEKVEIIEGGGAVLYGSGTSGGVINITTNLKGMNKPQNSLGFEYETDNKYRYFANAGVKIKDKAVIQANYSGEQSELYFKDTYKDSEYFGLGAAFKINDNQRLSFKYTNFQEDGKYVYNVSKDDLDKYGKDYVPKETRVIVGYDPVNKKYIYEYKKRYNQSDRDSTGLKASYSINFLKNFTLMTDLVSQEGTYRNSHYEDKDMDYHTYGLKTKLNWKYLPNHHLLMGVDWINQNATLSYPYYKKGVDYFYDYDKKTRAVFIHNKNKLGSFEFTQGFRFDKSDWDTTKPQGSSSKYAGINKKFKNERFNRAFELSSAWLYSDQGRVFARYERGFTTPDGIQMTDDVYIDKKTKVFVPTSAEDEIYDTYEIGIRDYFLNTFFTATAYITTTNNELNRVYVSSDVSGSKYKRDKKTLNLLETKRYGFDITAEQEFGKFKFFESYAWAKGETKYNSKGRRLIAEGSQIDWTDSGLEKVPEHKIVLGIDYDFTRNFTTGIKYKYTGGYNNYYDKEEKPEESLVDSNSIFDFKLKYKMDNGLTFHGGINNMFDETYYNYVASHGSGKSVWPAFGRTYYMGVKYTF